LVTGKQDVAEIALGRGPLLAPAAMLLLGCLKLFHHEPFGVSQAAFPR
jgi:hypothetical protein